MSFNVARSVGGFPSLWDQIPFSFRRSPFDSAFVYTLSGSTSLAMALQIELTNGVRQFYIPKFVCPSVPKTVFQFVPSESVFFYGLEEGLPKKHKGVKRFVYIYIPFGLEMDVATEEQDIRFVDATHDIRFDSQEGGGDYWMTSLRKYVPVASGSIMRIKNPTDLHELGSQPAASLSRSHLFLKSGFSKKIDRLALKGFQNNERKIEEQLGKSLPIVEKYLSMRIDTHKLGARRRKNFIHLHKLFSKYNSLAPYLKGLEKESAIPFSYPLLPFNSVPRLREELSKNGVYTPVLWGSLKAEELGQLEQTLLQVVHIPVSRKLMKRQEIFLREILEAKE